MENYYTKYLCINVIQCVFFVFEFILSKTFKFTELITTFLLKLRVPVEYTYCFSNNLRMFVARIFLGVNICSLNANLKNPLMNFLFFSFAMKKKKERNIPFNGDF